MCVHIKALKFYQKSFYKVYTLALPFLICRTSTFCCGEWL